jgi:hypothetical protein
MTTTGPDVRTTPLDRILTAALVVAPLLSLIADSTYATRGWDDATAGVVHVLGAIAYGFVVLRVAAWLPPSSRLAAAVVVAGLIGMAGNVAYGFEAIHHSFGDVELVDRGGAATVIKPLGLCFPLALALMALALRQAQRRVAALLIVVAALGWPVAHIANIGPLAVAVNVLLVVGFGSLTWHRTAG